MNQSAAPEWANRMNTLDPALYRPRFYALDIVIDNAAGSTGGGSVTLDNTPFILDRITHSILGALVLDQDGQYLISIRDDQYNYTQRPVVAQGALGGVYGGASSFPLPLRAFFRGSATISVDVTNLRDRAYGPGNWVLQIVFVGFERRSAAQ